MLVTKDSNQSSLCELRRDRAKSCDFTLGRLAYESRRPVQDILT